MRPMTLLDKQLALELSDHEHDATAENSGDKACRN